MKAHVFISQVIALTLLSAPALAQGAGNTLQLAGTTIPRCAISNAATRTAGDALLVASSVANSQIIFPGLADESGFLSENTIQLTFEGVWCNKTAKFKLASQNRGLLNPAQATAGYTNKVNYIASALWGGQITGLQLKTSDVAEAEKHSAEPYADSLIININTVAEAGVRLIAGDYSDVLTLSIEPDV
jgi:hypothetical protein